MLIRSVTQLPADFLGLTCSNSSGSSSVSNEVLLASKHLVDFNFSIGSTDMLNQFYHDVN